MLLHSHLCCHSSVVAPKQSKTSNFKIKHPEAMTADFRPLCTSKVIWQPIGQQKLYGNFCGSSAYGSLRRNQTNIHIKDNKFRVFASSKGSTKSGESEEAVPPSWATPDADEPPPWARDEGIIQTELKDGFEFPFFVYLLASAVTAIAAIGSIFEYVNQKPVFGIVNSDSLLYAPLLGFFAFTGIPTSAFLWFKSVQVANKEAEEQDRRDGFR